MRRERDFQDMIDILVENPRATAQEIEERLAKLARQRESEAIKQMEEAPLERGRERGRKSEKRVKRVAESLDIVDSVRETVLGDWEDSAGRDLVVNFEGYQYVYVQVKSSEKAVKEFIGDDPQARKKLKVRRLIVINGQDDEKVIRKNFLNHLKGVDDYWRKRGQPILSPKLRSLLNSKLAVVHLE